MPPLPLHTTPTELTRLYQTATHLLHDGFWIQGTAARSLRTHSVEAYSPQACGWCVTGVILAAQAKLYGQPAARETVRLTLEHPPPLIQALKRQQALVWCHFNHILKTPHLDDFQKLNSPNSIAHWNDHPNRRPEHVHRLFRKAIRTAPYLPVDDLLRTLDKDL